MEAYGTDQEEAASDGSTAEDSIENVSSRDTSPDRGDDTVMGDHDGHTEAATDRSGTDVFMAPAPHTPAAQITSNDLAIGLGHTVWKDHQRGRAEQPQPSDAQDLGLGGHFDRFERSLQSHLAPSLEQLRKHVQTSVAGRIADLENKQAALLSVSDPALEYAFRADTD